MPKLLMFTACERVVVGGPGDNTASIVAIIQGFTVEGADVPRSEGDAINALPIAWNIFALWDRQDSPDTYQYRTELFSPHGRSLVKFEAALQFEESKRFLRLVAKVPAFPIDGVGEYLLKHSLRTNDGEYIEQASFPMPVSAVITEASAPLAIQAKP